MEIADSPELRIRDTLTIEAWFKTDGFVEGESQRILSKNGYISGSTIGYDFAITDNKLRFSYNNSDWTYSYSNEGIVFPNVWNHGMVVYDEGAVNYYLNGVNVGSDSLASLLPLATNGLYIGRYHSVSTYWAGEFNGLIDEVRIYNRALSAEEVQEHYSLSRRDMIIK
jgi:hypothetical protein